MKKRILSLALVFCVVICIFPLAGNAVTNEATSPAIGSKTFDLRLAGATAPRFYYALEGSYSVAMPALNGGHEQMYAGSWHVMYAHEDSFPVQGKSYSFGKALYGIGGNTGAETADGLLFGIQNMAPGRYNLQFGAKSSFEAEQLRIIGKTEKVITETSGPINPVAPDLSLNDGWQGFLLGALRYGIYNTDFYPQPADILIPLKGKNDVVVDLRGYNLTPADIIGATLKDELGEVKATLLTVLPGSKKDNGLVELFLVMRFAGALPEKYSTYTLALTTGEGVSCDADDQIDFSGSELSGFRVDLSGIADRKIAIVTDRQFETLPDNLSVTVNYLDFDVSALVPITSPLQAVRSGSNRYVLTLPEKTFFRNENQSQLVLTFNLNNTPQEVSFSLNNIMGQWYYPYPLPLDVNGYTLHTTPISAFYNAESAVYTLVDSNFSPVPGVSIKEDSEYYGFHDKRYVFSGEGLLTEGATYYILMGSFPIFMLTAEVNVPTMNAKITASAAKSDSEDQFYIEPSYYGFQGADTFKLKIYSNSYGAVKASEWSVILTSLIAGGTTYNLNTEDSTPKLTYITEDGFNGEFTCGLDQINPGPYKLEIFNNGVKQNPENSDFFICNPPRAETYAEHDYTDSYNPHFVSSHYITFSGHLVAPSGTSGWKLAAYKQDGVFLDYTPITVNLPDLILDGGTNNFRLNLPASALKAAGVTAGQWFIALTDNNGKLIMTNSLRLTSKFLNSSPEVQRTVSGMVYYKDAPLPGARVELWKDGVKVNAASVSSAGEFRLTASAPGEHLLKILEGTIAGARTFNITLPDTLYNIEYNLGKIRLSDLIQPKVSDIHYNITDIWVSFSKYMDDSIKNNIKVQSGGVDIPGSWQWFDTPMLIFTPDEPFAPGSTVTITVPGSSIDVDGIPLGEDTVKSFNIPRKFENGKISSPITTIVAGYSATILFKIENVPKDAASAVLNGPNGTIGIVDGTFGAITIPSAEEGTYHLLLLEDGYYNYKYCTINCVAPPTNLWKPRILFSGDTFQVVFGADIELKDVSITVGGVKVTDFTYEGMVVTVNTPANSTVVLSGVKYPALFPNYKFTFTLPVL